MADSAAEVIAAQLIRGYCSSASTNRLESNHWQPAQL